MTRKVLVFEVVLVAAVLAAVVVVYPRLSSEVPTHWNSSFQADGYSPKWAIFLLGPGLMAALTAFTYAGPWLSPAKFSVDEFTTTFERMMLILFCLATYCAGVILWAGMGHALDVGRTMLGGICVLVVALGNWMGKVRRNFFLGFKTPWTLASERVWNATHRLAGKTLVAGGLLALALTLLNVSHWPMYVMVAAFATPMVYSLVLYKQLERRGELHG